MYLPFIPSRLAVWALCFLVTLSYGIAIPDNSPPTKPPPTKPAPTKPPPTKPSHPACAKRLPRGVAVGQTTNVSIQSNGIKRSFLINIPEAYETKVMSPVILSFHGGERNASQQLELDLLFLPDFNTMGAVLVYPQGIDESWQGIPGSTANDTGFVSDILTELSSSYCVNTAQIYATGKSDGAGFCNTLACDSTLSTQIAAFAPVSGAFYQSTLPCQPTSIDIQCVPGRDKIPFLEFHGGNDSTIDYFGGERKAACLPSITYFMQSWASRNGLSTVFTNSLTALDTVVYSYGKGADTGLVTHVFDTNIGHDWPSTLPNSDNTEPGHHIASFNASTAIMEFFSKYSLPSTTHAHTPLLVQGELLSIFDGPID